MLTYAKKILSSGALLALALTAVTACTVQTPREELAYCQAYATWATGASSAAGNCEVPSIASRDPDYNHGSISQ